MIDVASLTRLRWRLRGAWMWPSFVVLAIVDGVIVSWRPFLGDSGSPVVGVLLGWVASLVLMTALNPPLGWALRRVRGDMPTLVARDYAGAAICLLITCLLLLGGLIHHPTAVADQNALENASATAEAYIGDHAPQRFRSNLRSLSAYELQPAQIYRICAQASKPPAGLSGPIWYCVSVNLAKPFAQSVTYAGSEPNSELSQGTG